MVAVGAWLEQRVARVRSFGVRDALTIEGATMRRLVKTTVAATLAWEVAALVNSPRPVLAPLGAILVVQVTVRSSFSRSIQLTVAVTIGLGGALLLGHVLGLHWWSVGLAILLGLVVGELLRLGPFSAQAAVSALLALSLGSTYGYERLVDTAIGALIGVLVNALIAPPTYVQEASQALRRVGDDLSVLLDDVAAGLHGQPDLSTVQRWLARAREISASLSAADSTVNQGEESLRFNHRKAAELARLERLGQARVALEHATNQTRGIVRSLVELYPQLRSPEVAPVLEALDELLCSASVQVATFGRLQQQPDTPADRDESERAHQAALAARDQAAKALGAMTEPADGAARLLASILVDGERLIREVDARDGVHLGAVAAGVSSVRAR
jgi:uncharacterized membrane protein YgaE (UPF0421/DUF939 family)